ncbi:MAG TPA: DNA-deoxyinosine glycosylase [Arenimonas sp.]|nr:DNA-deoxyinosine glycosylase [Arenimonas sp.]
MHPLPTPRDETAMPHANHGLSWAGPDANEPCETPDAQDQSLPNAGSENQLRGMPPILGDGARVLVLGSMPGAESLRRREYYGHARNHFWRIIQDIYLIPRDLPYPVRVEALRGAGVAVWDVLASCHRQGSLDAAIDRASMRVNAIDILVRSQPRLERIVFNGAFAAQVYRSCIEERVGAVRQIATLRLPSTSPANASFSYERKLAAWRAGLLPGSAPCCTPPRRA